MSITIALKVDVDTLRGTREGVPRLLRALQAHGADATFYFSVGPDHTGRALRRVFRPGFAQKVVRTSVVKHYGLKTLMYGVLLPGPDIGREAGDVMRATRDAGFEVGLHTFDHVRWQDYVTREDAAWTRREFELGVQAFTRIFGAPPASHAAAGWQMNEHALQLEQEYKLDFASDTRGATPFFPLLGDSVSTCMQLPTTLPTFDELLGREGIDENNVAEAIVERIGQAPPAQLQVFTLHAELEGMRLLGAFESLLQKCRASGASLVCMSAVHALARQQQPSAARVVMSELPGRSGLLATQGPAATRSAA